MHQSRESNLLLAELSERDYQQFVRHLERITVETHQAICSPGQPLQHAYFPTTSMLSSIIVFADGKTVETATIGKEGMVGVGLLVDERANPFRVIVQVKGEALRISADRFVQLLNVTETLTATIQRYMFTLLRQCGQNAACNLHHAVKPRMARWLLHTSDRAGRINFHLSQEFLSEMLGVSRQTVNVTARSLQVAELIDYERGQVRLLDRAGLENVACECYAAYNDMYERYMGTEIKRVS